MSKGKDINLSLPQYRMKDGSIYWIYIKQFLMDVLRQERQYNKRMDHYWRYHPEFRKWEKRMTYKRNRRRLLDYFSERYQEHKERLREYGRKHYRENAARYIVRARNRRGDLRAAEAGLACGDMQSLSLLYKFRDILNGIHGRIAFHVDHIIPLSRGGDHGPSNLCLATAEYNTWKRCRIIDDPSIYLGQGVK